MRQSRPPGFCVALILLPRSALLCVKGPLRRLWHDTQLAGHQARFLLGSDDARACWQRKPLDWTQKNSNNGPQRNPEAAVPELSASGAALGALAAAAVYA